jgi:hypothetical protein
MQYRFLLSVAVYIPSDAMQCSIGSYYLWQSIYRQMQCNAVYVPTICGSLYTVRWNVLQYRFLLSVAVYIPSDGMYCSIGSWYLNLSITSKKLTGFIFSHLKSHSLSPVPAVSQTATQITLLNVSNNIYSYNSYFPPWQGRTKLRFSYA